jgi:hypothetical protein
MTMRSPRPVWARQPASVSRRCLQVGLGELHRREHGERVLHEVHAGRADA